MAHKVLGKIGTEIFNARYAYPGETEWAERARIIAKVAASCETDEQKEKQFERFYQTIANGDLIPGGRIIFGAGRPNQNLLNCYALQPEDTVQSIGKVIQDMYKISCGGGGIGFNFSAIRPKGDDIQNIKNSAPGSISNMQMINEIGNHVKAGKSRRTALLAILNVTHPDLLEFLTVKLDKKELNNFNISVGITNRFLEAVENDEEWYFTFGTKKYNIFRLKVENTELNSVDRFVEIPALSPLDAIGRAEQHHKQHWKDTFTYVQRVSLKAKDIWEKIFKNSVECGDPGFFNVDLVNSYSNIYWATMSQPNPCLAKGTKVNTPFGYKNIEDIKEGDLVTTINGYEPVKSVESHTNLPVFKVQFSDGGELLATEAHIFHTFKGCSNKLLKVPLSEVSVGDSIRVVAKEIKHTDLLDYKVGLKQGILLGDGSITGCSKKISSSKKDTEYNLNVKLLFGADNFRSDDSSTISNSMNMCFSTEYSRIVLNELKLSPNYSEEKFIPETTLNSYSKCLGVIDGLIATDGNILLQSKTPQARITTCSQKLAQDIRRALLNLGIHGHIYNSFYQDGGTIDGRVIERKHTRYDIHIMADGLMKLAKISMLHLIHPEKGRKLKLIGQNYVLNSGTYKAKILSIEPAGKSDVYDLYCEESDTWVTDGYVSRGCGEIPLEPYANCCLGHINLSNMVLDDGSDMDWRKLANAVRVGVRFLDNILTVNHYPLDECRVVGQESRRIGLGVIGLHYALIKLGLRYGSDKAVEFVERLMETIRNEAYLTSCFLGEEKGSFPKFNYKKFLDTDYTWTLPARIRMLIKRRGIRNAVLLTCAPTGTIGMLMEVSTGIEPIFSWAYKRRYRQANVWKEQVIVDPLFKEFYDKGKDLSVFVGAYDISPEDHLKMQAAIQKYIDNSISKTINLPKEAKWEDLSSVALHYMPYLKGLTLYRAGSKMGEPMEAIPLTQTNIDLIMSKGDIESGIGEVACAIGDSSCGS